MKNDDILRSWKEISAYLECDRRTCLRWEKSLGLPIHRMEGSEKGGVFAYREELDKWLVERSGHPEPAKPETEIVEAGRKWVRLETRRWSRKRLTVFHLIVFALIFAPFTLSVIQEVSSATSSFSISSPLILIRSVKSMRWGDV